MSLLNHLPKEVELRRLCKNNQLNEALQTMKLMVKKGTPLSRDIIFSVLQACSAKQDIMAVRQVHNLISISGFLSSLGHHLISMFGSCGSLDEANQIFGEIPKRSSFTWNAIISTHVKHGKPGRAFELYCKMHEEGQKPDKYIFSQILKACSGLQDVKQGQLIHEQIVMYELEVEIILANCLIDMYAKCESMEDACNVFEKLTNPDSVSWGTMIAGYAQQGQGISALQMLSKMWWEGLKLNRVSVLAALKACKSIGGISQGRILHSQIMESELEPDVHVGSTLVDMYAKCASLHDALRVFEKLKSRNEVSWSAMITGYVQHGQDVLALEFYEKMQEEEIRQCKVTFLGALKACGGMEDIMLGRLVHGQIVSSGFAKADVVLGSSLVDMYSKCGGLAEAQSIFDCLPTPDVIPWSAMIAGYAQHGDGVLALQLFEKMQQQNIKPNVVTFLSVLKACSILVAGEQGRLLHDHIIRSELDADVLIASSLIDMYGKCGNLEEARVVLKRLPGADVVSWGAVISGYVQHGEGDIALELFVDMQRAEIKADHFVLSSILKACGNVRALVEGRFVHNLIVKSGVEKDMAIGNALIDMFTKGGSLNEAYRVFINLQDRDVITWATIIGGYVQHGHSLFALELFSKMLQDHIDPDKVIFISLFKACGSIQAIKQGRLVHKQIILSVVEPDVTIGSTLLDMYANCGSLEEARKVFDDLPNQNVVSWDAMITGYVDHGYNISALELFERMQKNEVTPTKVTFFCILKGCGALGVIDQGRLVHHLILKSELEVDLTLGSTLVDMYAKCGSLDEAQNVLTQVPDRNVVSWGAMIAGYAQHGNSSLVSQSLKAMKKQGVLPNDAIFTNILTGCSHAALLSDGLYFFRSMREDHDIMPGPEHYNCMVDLFGRAGRLMEAEDLLQTMPLPPNLLVWTSLLTSCNTYGNMGLGEQCFDQGLFLDPTDASGYVLMSNMYKEANVIEELDRVQGLKSYTGAWKKPGKAWIEVNTQMHEFIIGGKTHPYKSKICAWLHDLSLATREAGCVPQVHLVSDYFSYGTMEDALEDCKESSSEMF